MASDIYKNAVQEFLGALSEVREYTDFVAASANMRPILNTAVDRGRLYGEGPQIMQSYFAAKCDAVKLSCNAAIIAVGSSFEGFIRRILRDAVNWINESCRPYGHLNEQLVKYNLVVSGKALATVFEPPAEFESDYQTLCVNLGTCKKEATFVVLNSAAFTFGVSGVNVGGINKALKRLDVEIDWNHVAAHAGFKKHCNTKTTAETKKYIEDYLADFIISRNKIAHMGLGTVPSSVDTNRQMLEFFELLAPQLAVVIEEMFVKRNPHKKN